jgi:hypothetical protein
MKIFIFIFFTHTVWAGFLDGQWMGTGKLVVSTPHGLDENQCFDVYFDIAHTPERIKIFKASFKCEGGNLKEYKTTSLDILGGKLLYNGQEIGEIGDQYLMAKFNDESSQTEFQLTAKSLDQEKREIIQTEKRKHGVTITTSAILE